LIPSRMSANRLPGKPLLKINNLSMISHVFKKAEETKIGEVVVATEDKEILDDVEKNGGKAILTCSTHKTGTDRIFEAYEKLNIKDIDFILNLQGDEPNIDKNDIINLNNFMINNNSEIGTLAAEIKSDKMLNDQNVVKVITESKLENKIIIEDLIVAAHNNAKSELKSKTSEEISKSTSGFGIPGFKWPAIQKRRRN
ncbi:hypothetical protein OAU55_00630, partial [Candidatus Pelagibacter sp.]|nr:hypothetical protein [Candidatus Pelagibacter sp.]